MNAWEEIATEQNLVKVVCSNPFDKKERFAKITLRPVLSKTERIFQAEKLTDTQAFHENVAQRDFAAWFAGNVDSVFKQICIFCEEKTVTYLFSAKGGVKRLEKKESNKQQRQTFNREKNYILKEGQRIPAFVDLGVFTKDFKIVQSHYDKFKQINRFIELIDDCFKNFSKDSITILDFGCGKSYLTFFVYYYFVEVKKIRAKVIGYDLKTDVVEQCNEIAKKYGYNGLRFVVADVSKDKLFDEKIDMVISLHACDTATDYALNYAVERRADFIFSVPCCQHEVNQTIVCGNVDGAAQCNADLNVLLKYGIVKERVSALLTDTVRAMLLEDEGYSVDVLEFVDLTHSPKNLMIRARKVHKKCAKNSEEIERLQQNYHFEQTLYKLLRKKSSQGE